MTDKDNIIKNPARAAQKEQDIYIPEYKRLNKDPIFMGADPNYKTYNSVDAEIIGDEIIENGHIIDNNDYVNFMTPTHQTKNKQEYKVIPPKSTSPNIGDYILMVSGKTIDFGSLKMIEDKVKAIIYGEDENFIEQDITIDDIVVLKRISVRVGIFVEE